MSYDSQKRKTLAESQVRGADGTFLKTKIEERGPHDALVDEPLVSVTIQNPFQKILHWIDEIRRKQETVFSIQLKLPLMVVLSLFALGISLATSSKIFYDWGQLVGLRAVLAKPVPTPAVIILPTAEPAPIMVSRVGILKGSYSLDSGVSDAEEATKTGQINPNRYMLEDKDGNIVFVQTSAKINLQTYIGKRLLISGLFSVSENVLRVSKSTDVEVIR